MKVIIEKSDTVDTVLGSLSSLVGEKYFYLPGWFEKTPEGDFIFHHMNKLPKELVDLVEEQRETPKTDKA